MKSMVLEIGKKAQAQSSRKYKNGLTGASWNRLLNDPVKEHPAALYISEYGEEMKTVYLLWHSHPTGANENNEKLIGVYSSLEEAQSAQKRLANKPGFATYPEGFEIVEYPVGKDNWTEGYFTE